MKDSIPTLIKETFRRPAYITPAMVFLVLLVPLYVFIPLLNLGSEHHIPELPLDRMIPVIPDWSMVYLPLYAFLIILPVLVVRQKKHIDRTVYAYISLWVTSYIVFMIYPTVLPRPEKLDIKGPGPWLLAQIWYSDAPFNCFPSIHVGHSFISAFTCLKLHRKTGIALIGAACLVALSTLFTKQHYVMDVIGGTALAVLTYFIYIRHCPCEVPEIDRKIAPVVTSVLFLTVCLLVILGYIAYYFTA